MKNHEDKIILEFPLPGFNREEIKVNLYDNKVHIIASRKKDIKEERKGYFHEETTEHNFEYRSTLPQNAYTRNAKIDFKNNVLKIEIPKIILKH